MPRHHILGTESRNFVKKPFNKKNFFPKKEKKIINHFVALAGARSLTRRGKQCSITKKNFFLLPSMYDANHIFDHLSHLCMGKKIDFF